MGSAFHQLCPRYSGTLTPTAPTANRPWETFTFFFRNDFRTQVRVRPAMLAVLNGNQKSSLAKRIDGNGNIDMYKSWSG